MSNLWNIFNHHLATSLHILKENHIFHQYTHACTKKNQWINVCKIVNAHARIQKLCWLQSKWKKYARKVESNYYAFTHLQIWSLHTTPVKIIHALTIVNRQKESNQHLLPFLLNKSLNKAGALEPLSYSGIYIFSHFDIQSVLLESNNNQ